MRHFEAWLIRFQTETEFCLGIIIWIGYVLGFGPVAKLWQDVLYSRNAKFVLKKNFILWKFIHFMNLKNMTP